MEQLVDQMKTFVHLYIPKYPAHNLSIKHHSICPIFSSDEHIDVNSPMNELVVAIERFNQPNAQGYW